jgi:uncharacterized membrane protein (UPF0127 family)
MMLGLSTTPTEEQTLIVEDSRAQVLPITATAQMGDQVIQLEVARTRSQQALGLMFRPPLPDNRGMLFPFEPPRPVQFWMRDVPVPLDMVFLREGEIQAIAAEVPPCTTRTCPVYGPATEVDQVIELRSGRAAELGLAVGDRVIIEFLED